jgi:hypothetical protein
VVSEKLNSKFPKRLCPLQGKLSTRSKRQTMWAVRQPKKRWEKEQDFGQGAGRVVDDHDQLK